MEDYPTPPTFRRRTKTSSARQAEDESQDTSSSAFQLKRDRKRIRIQKTSTEDPSAVEHQPPIETPECQVKASKKPRDRRNWREFMTPERVPKREPSLSAKVPPSGTSSMVLTPMGTPTWQLNTWEKETTPSGTPILFKGMDPALMSSLSGGTGSLTSSLLGGEFEEKLLNEISAEWEDDEQQFDRNWYDADENTGAYDRPDDDPSLVDREEKVLRRAGHKSQKQNQFQFLRSQDQTLWEYNRMHQSGVARMLPPTDVTVSDEQEARVHVCVREVHPAFIEKNGGGTINMEAENEVSLCKEPGCDMMVMARKGSGVVRYFRGQQDKAAMRDRFWELQGTDMGAAIGVAGPKGEARARTEQEVKTDAMFSTYLKTAQASSAFARTKSVQEQRESLPVYNVRSSLLSLLREHSVVIVVGETGSGKTTQLTQYMFEDGWGSNGIIGCTQPRRVAAVSVAKRVADERGGELGGEVGYAIRFEDCTSRDTRIKYMTDGVLLREALLDKVLERYTAVIMDEAHERSLNTDVLFGVLRDVVAVRRDFRLIVTSATMDASLFSRFFGNAPVFEIPGRTFPVTVEWMRAPAADYVDAAVQKTLQVHCGSNPEGDVLIFMTGQEDIEATCYLLAERAHALGEKAAPLTILPIYSQLPSDLQARVFAPSKHRKVIVATNIAETSLTLDGVRFVIDSGYCKLKVYQAKMGMDSLQIVPVSQANASQRAGRAGRTGPGVCYRLYTERSFLSDLNESSIPEIQRSNLANVMLLLKNLGIQDVFSFHFMSTPPKETIVSSLYQLWVLGALDNDGEITAFGKDMCQFPLDPPLSRMLLSSSKIGCSEEILVIVSLLSVPNIFFRPKDRSEESDNAREKFFVPESDHLTLLNVFHQWKRHNYSAQWCSSHYLHFKSLKKAREIRAQLVQHMTSSKIPLDSCGNDWDLPRRAICSGYFHHSSKARGIGEFVNLRTSVTGHLHPTSALFSAGQTPEYVVYHEVVLTSKEYLQNVTSVDPEWLAEDGPMFFYLKRTGNRS